MARSRGRCSARVSTSWAIGLYFSSSGHRQISVRPLTQVFDPEPCRSSMTGLPVAAAVAASARTTANPGSGRTRVIRGPYGSQRQATSSSSAAAACRLISSTSGCIRAGPFTTERSLPKAILMSSQPSPPAAAPQRLDSSRPMTQPNPVAVSRLETPSRRYPRYWVKPGGHEGAVTAKQTACPTRYGTRKAHRTTAMRGSSACGPGRGIALRVSATSDGRRSEEVHAAAAAAKTPRKRVGTCPAAPESPQRPCQ